jgi:hypothetical protein
MWHDMIAQGLVGRTPEMLAGLIGSASVYPDTQVEIHEPNSSVLRDAGPGDTESANHGPLAQNAQITGGALGAVATKLPAKRRERLSKETRRFAQDGNNS